MLALSEKPRKQIAETTHHAERAIAAVDMCLETIFAGEFDWSSREIKTTGILKHDSKQWLPSFT